jgi:hypothetical protein
MNVRTVVRKAAVVVDGRLSFHPLQVPAAAGLAEVDRLIDLWRAAVKDPRPSNVSRIPSRLRAELAVAAGRYLARSKVGHGATPERVFPFHTFRERAERAAESNLLASLYRAGLLRATTGGTNTIVLVDDEVKVTNDYSVVWPRDAAHVAHPNAYGWRAHCCTRVIVAPFGALWKAHAAGRVVVLPGIGELRASRGTGLALWVQGPRSGWRRA